MSHGAYSDDAEVFRPCTAKGQRRAGPCSSTLCSCPSLFLQALSVELERGPVGVGCPTGIDGFDVRGEGDS